MPQKDENFEIQNELIQSILKQIGSVVGSALPLDYGFLLMIFSFKGPELFYISNAQREDMINIMEECIVKMKEKNATKGS